MVGGLPEVAAGLPQSLCRDAAYRIVGVAVDNAKTDEYTSRVFPSSIADAPA